MSSFYDENLLAVYGLDKLCDKTLKPVIGKTIFYLIQVFWNHWGEDKGTPLAYNRFLRGSLKTLLEGFKDIDALYKKEERERADAAILDLIHELYEYSKPYLREQGVKNI